MFKSGKSLTTCHIPYWANKSGKICFIVPTLKTFRRCAGKFLNDMHNGTSDRPQQLTSSARQQGISCRMVLIRCTSWEHQSSGNG